MYVECLSTRHTAVGTFRFGVVYDVDEADHRVAKATRPLLEGETPALKKISKKSYEEKKGAQFQFSPMAGGPETGATAADLREKLAAVTAEKEAEAKRATGAEEARDAAVERADAAEAKVAELEVDLATAKEASGQAGGKE